MSDHSTAEKLDKKKGKSFWRLNKGVDPRYNKV